MALPAASNKKIIFHRAEDLIGKTIYGVLVGRSSEVSRLRSSRGERIMCRAQDKEQTPHFKRRACDLYVLK